MGNRYSREEQEQIKSLVKEGLTNREIAVQLGRPEAGIKNLRYRLDLTRDIKDSIRSLRNEKEGLEAQKEKLDWSIRDLSIEVRSLEEKRTRVGKALALEEKLLKMKIETQLTSLRMEKPELFHISGAEQIARLCIELLEKWLLS